jgi:hypothetical protein
MTVCCGGLCNMRIKRGNGIQSLLDRLDSKICSAGGSNGSSGRGQWLCWLRLPYGFVVPALVYVACIQGETAKSELHPE